MNQTKVKSSTHFVCSLIIGFISTLPLVVEAKNVNWSSGTYTHFSKQEPLKKLLEAMAADQNIPIIVSDEVTDIVSVYFKKKSPKTIIDQLKLAYGLISFYDGDILYIYKSTETQTAKAKLKKGSVLVLDRYIKNENLLEPNMKWELSIENNQVSFSGTKRFVDIVLKKAKSLDDEDNKKIFKCTMEGKVTYSNSPPQFELCQETKIHKFNPPVERENTKPSITTPVRPLTSSEDLVELEKE